MHSIAGYYEPVANQNPVEHIIARYRFRFHTSNDEQHKV